MLVERVEGGCGIWHRRNNIGRRPYALSWGPPAKGTPAGSSREPVGRSGAKSPRLTQQKGNFEKMGLFRWESPLHNHPLKYGCARVSTDGQSVDAQVRQLEAAGCKTVFREVATGAKT